jgi:hypothetical protein
MPYICKVIALFGVAALVNACVPFPHYALVSPAIDGKVHQNGRPIESATVYIPHPVDGKPKCSSKSEVAARTGSDGSFRFDMRKELQFILAMDHGCNWQMCIAEGAAVYLGWFENGLGCPSAQMAFDCNLNDPPHATKMGNSRPRTMGICRSINAAEHRY